MTVSGRLFLREDFQLCVNQLTVVKVEHCGKLADKIIFVGIKRFISIGNQRGGKSSYVIFEMASALCFYYPCYAQFSY